MIPSGSLSAHALPQEDQTSARADYLADRLCSELYTLRLFERARQLAEHRQVGVQTALG
jgi:hypothetical protein